MNLKDYPYLNALYTESQNLAAARIMDVIVKDPKASSRMKSELESAIDCTDKRRLELLGNVQLGNMTELEEKYVESTLLRVRDEINSKVLVDDPTKYACVINEKGKIWMEMVLSDEYIASMRPYVEHSFFSRSIAKRGNPSFGRNRIHELGRSIVGRGSIEPYEVTKLENLITEHMLFEWADRFNKVEITTCPAPQNTISYKMEPLTEDTAIKLMSGEYTMDDIVIKPSTISMKISESVFSSFQSPGALCDFMERAVKMYNEDIPAYGEFFTRALATSPMSYKLAFSNPQLLGHLESTMLQLFSYQGFDSNDPSDLQLTTEDVYALTSLYAGVPEAHDVDELKKQKTKVIDAFKEDSKYIYISPKHTKEIVESLEKVYSEKSAVIGNSKLQEWYLENSKTVQPITEAWGTKRKKRLKKIPLSTIAYVQVEGENIRDANDKYMIAAYCLGKIELVEWYIELIQSGSEKYEVPHDLRYLERMRTDLLAAYKTIMSRPIPRQDRPIIDIKYPEDLPMGK